jgi:TonB family protein
MKPNDTTYGYQELRNHYQRSMSWALSIAVSIELLLIGGYHLSNWLASRNDSDSSEGRIRTRIIELLPPPPPLDNRIEAAAVAVIPPKLAIGLPVPVPDFAADTEIEFATTEDLANEANRKIAEAGILGPIDSIVIPPDVDPSPDTFQAIEILPRPVSTPRPQYPEVMRRSGIEGNVFLQVLITKEGKVKKTRLIKTDADLFVQPATEAAMNWVFTPALMNGKPVPVWVAIPFRFRLTQ